MIDDIFQGPADAMRQRQIPGQVRPLSGSGNNAGEAPLVLEGMSRIDALSNY